jgi:hypothetical protein
MEEFVLYSYYRKNVQKYATNYFLKRGLSVQDKYTYILKESKDWSSNIIMSTVADEILRQKLYAEANKVSFPLHKYLHHGLSSQAMLFNLFGEAQLKNDYTFFQNVFQFSDIVIDSRYKLKFEHYDRVTFNERQQQPTSFDFAIVDETKRCKSIFIEAKYVETEFGGCSAIKGGECDGQNPVSNHQSCYLTSKGRNYWELMRKYGIDTYYYSSPICPFAIYYQFFREIMFALENNAYFVILIDKRNPAFERIFAGEFRGLIPTLTRSLPDSLKQILKVLYIQDVLPILAKHGYTWVDEFKEKYGM